MKTCTRCRRELALDRFCVNRAQKSGLNSSCKDCQKQCNATYDRKAWRDANRQHLNAVNKAWREAHPEHCAQYRSSRAELQREAHAAWRAANPQKVKEAKAAWAANNRHRKNQLNELHRQRNQHKFNAREAKRRSAKVMATPAWANEFFIEEAYDLARVRSEVMGFEWEVDHIVPLKSQLVCGLHVEANLAVIPAVANRAKGNKYWPDMP